MNEQDSTLVAVVTDETIEEFFSSSSQPILLAMGATWCPDCRRIEPFFMKFAQMYKDKIIFARCDFDTNPNIKEKFNVHHIPTLFYVKDGKVLDTLVEPKDVALFKAFVEKLL